MSVTNPEPEGRSNRMVHNIFELSSCHSYKHIVPVKCRVLNDTTVDTTK